MAVMDRTDEQKLTWAALLGRWIEFAQAAVALPDDAEGRMWRAATPAVIGLQALCMALRDVDRLPPDQRALGLDRAQLLIERHTAELNQIFADQPLHPTLSELLADAETALANARGS